MDTMDAIISVFEKRCKAATGTISKETNISDLGIDSLMYMEIIMDLESTLQKSLSDEMIIQVLLVEKIGDLHDLFSKLPA